MVEFRVSDPVTFLLIESLQKLYDKKLAESKALGKNKSKPDAAALDAIAQVQSASGFRSSSLAHARQAAKDLNKNSKELSDHLISLLHKYKNGDITLSKFKSFASIAIKAQTEEAFRLGVKAAGIVGPTGGLKDLSKSDKQWLANYLREELKYFSKFLADVQGGETTKRSEIRLAAYAATIKSAYESGRVLNYGQSVVIYWVLEGDNPCPDCKYLHSQSPFTADRLPTVPKGGSTRCGAHCYCSLRIVKASPEELAKLQKKSKSALWHLDRIKRNRKKR